MLEEFHTYQKQSQLVGLELGSETSLVQLSDYAEST